MQPYMAKMKVWNGENSVADFKLMDVDFNELDKPTALFGIGETFVPSSATILITFKVN